MAQYAIEDTTMTALADSVRRVVGETRLEEISSTYIGNYIVSKTDNALSFTEKSGSYATSLSTYDVITIPGAVKIVVDVAYQTEGTSYDYLQVASGAKTSMPSATTKYGGKTLTRKEITFTDTDTITFYFYSDSSGSDYLGYYAECRGYDAENNVIEIYEKEYEEVPNTMTIEEMITQIGSITWAMTDVEPVFSSAYNSRTLKCDLSPYIGKSTSIPFCVSFSGAPYQNTNNKGMVSIFYDGKGNFIKYFAFANSSGSSLGSNTWTGTLADGLLTLRAENYEMGVSTMSKTVSLLYMKGA